MPINYMTDTQPNYSNYYFPMHGVKNRLKIDMLLFLNAICEKSIGI